MLMLKNESGGEMFYATRESAGFDIAASEALIIPPGEWRLVPTGLRIIENAPLQDVSYGALQVTVLPELQIRPRSGLAVKFGITVLNTPSTIDADYRGEIRIPLINHSKVPFEVHVGDRIAQGICALVFHAPNITVRDTVRGEGGFGSTGGKTGLTS
ncbi:MAG: dUTP diphosphatase [Silvanigrellales bacterium]|nr:dUTP diphosphatase [Silvanigrellales bacterium]